MSRCSLQLQFDLAIALLPVPFVGEEHLSMAQPSKHFVAAREVRQLRHALDAWVLDLLGRTVIIAEFK